MSINEDFQGYRDVAKAEATSEAKCSSRQSGRNAILDEARRLEAGARDLFALAMAIPENFPHDADAGLWRLAMRLR